MTARGPGGAGVLRRGLTPQDLGLAGTFPVTVITGFLGSGKTTLLARLLAHPETRNTAVIVNELGEVGLDHLLVESPVDETVLLEGGCVCCTLRGDLSATLQGLVARRVTGDIPAFERVVVETTGTADPVPLVQTLVEDPDVGSFFRLDGLLTVIDARNGPVQLDRHFQAVKQAALADRVLITKPDLVGDEALRALTERVRALNPGVPVDVVAHGEVAPARILGAGLRPRPGRGAEVESWLGEAACEAAVRARESACAAGHHHGDVHAHHRHDDAIETFSVRREGEVHPAGLKLWLDLMSVFQGPDLLRVKGIVDVNGRPVVVNTVQHVSHPTQALDRWPSDERGSRIVFITNGLDRGALESTLSALDFMPGARAAAPGIDPEAYRRFTAILERFRGESRA